MTTIAYHHESRRIAVDGRVTAGDLIACDSYEKWRAVGDEVWFLSGATCDFDRFVAYHTKDTTGKPEHIISCSGVVASASGCYEVGITPDGEPWRSLSPYNVAVGSGRDFALAAMDHGGSASSAVRYASTRDTGTGGVVSVFDMDTMGFIEAAVDLAQPAV